MTILRSAVPSFLGIIVPLSVQKQKCGLCGRSTAVPKLQLSARSDPSSNLTVGARAGTSTPRQSVGPAPPKQAGVGLRLTDKHPHRAVQIVQNGPGSLVPVHRSLLFERDGMFVWSQVLMVGEQLLKAKKFGLVTSLSKWMARMLRKSLSWQVRSSGSCITNPFLASSLYFRRFP